VGEVFLRSQPLVSIQSITIYSIMYLKTGVWFFIYVSMACFILATGNNALGQVSDIAIASKADTSHFSPNTKDGWGILLGYANQLGNDSARLEIVIFRELAPNLQKSNLIGWIRNRQLRPVTTRVCPVQIGRRQFELKVEQNGAVWLLASTGQPLEAGKNILPIVIIYKR
jgi:hypothetical protein